MINHVKHDEDFFGIFKMTNGEEVLSRAVITVDQNESLIFLQDPVMVHVMTKPMSETKMVRGVGFVKWQQLSDEEFFVGKEKDVVCIATMSREVQLLYEGYLMTENGVKPTSHKAGYHIKPDKSIGYVGNTDDYREKLEDLFKATDNP